MELTPEAQTEWQFIKQFTKAADDAQAWEIMKRLENPFTYAERPGGGRAYVRAVRRVVSLRERSTELLVDDTSCFEGGHDDSNGDEDHSRGAPLAPPRFLGPSKSASADNQHLIRDVAVRLGIPERTLYRWYEHGEGDAIRVKGRMALTAKGMRQAERLVTDKRSRKRLMETLIERGSTASASKKLIQRGLANGETLREIADRVLAKSAG